MIGHRELYKLEMLAWVAIMVAEESKAYFYSISTKYIFFIMFFECYVNFTAVWLMIGVQWGPMSICPSRRHGASTWPNGSAPSAMLRVVTGVKLREKTLVAFCFCHYRGWGVSYLLLLF